MDEFKEKKIYECSGCDNVFKEFQNYVVHVKTHFRPESQPNNKNNTNLVAQVAVDDKVSKPSTSVKSTAKDLMLNEHFVEFEENLPCEMQGNHYRCTLCGLSSSNYDEYSKHEKMHYEVYNITDNS